ncbi:MAG: glycosyltransferase family A protein [Acidobacteria bacterium]|nr:glycosyltransferase family A protein [Acidobacteriota bacterium]
MSRVIIGSPLFNHAHDVAVAIESIVGQTFTDFALVLVDDGSTDSTGEIARAYAASDPRVSYHRNDTRLGLIDNSKRAFALAHERHPEAEYFAWTSDHDLWHPCWLERLVETLDAYADVVLAYPLNRRIGPAGEMLKRKPWKFDTLGVTNPQKRLRAGIHRMRAGNMVYGLYRVGVLQRAGVYRKVMIPDRLLCAELALYGQFAQVEQVLWFRRWYGRLFSLSRQRASFFPGRRPLYAYCPWWISHAVSLFWTFTVQGAGGPEVSRRAGVSAAAQYVVLSGLLHARQTLRALRDWVLDRGDALARRGRLASRSLMARRTRE